jgi:hypothetical protein
VKPQEKHQDLTDFLLYLAQGEKVMKYQVRLQRVTSGRIIAYCDDPKCSAGAPTRQEVLEKIKGEIRYRLEYCPCSTLRDGTIEVEVVEEKQAG